LNKINARVSVLKILSGQILSWLPTDTSLEWSYIQERKLDQ
jgi:hypothetical protein